MQKHSISSKMAWMKVYFQDLSNKILKDNVGHLRDQLARDYQGKYNQVADIMNEFWESEDEGVRVTRPVHDPSHEHSKSIKDEW
jgi:hypothetical protein